MAPNVHKTITSLNDSKELKSPIGEEPKEIFAMKRFVSEAKKLPRSISPEREKKVV